MRLSVRLNPITDAHYFTLWLRSAAITAELSWTSVRVPTGYHGILRVSTASATAHGIFTATATVVATARAAVLFVGNSVVSTKGTQGSPWQLPRQYPGNLHGHPRSLPRHRGNHHGSPRKSAAITTAVSADIQRKQYPPPSVAVRGHGHGNFPTRGDYYGSPGLSPQHVPQFCAWQTPSYQPCPRKFAAMATAVSAENAYRSPLRHPNDTQFPAILNHDVIRGHFDRYFVGVKVRVRVSSMVKKKK